MEVTPSAPERRDSHKALILGAICLAALILPLSITSAAIATPVIGRDLGGSPVALAWIVNAFMLSFGSVLMAAGSLADEFGRKRLFLLGVAMFSLVSLALAFAPNVATLDILRAVQGIAAAFTLSGGTAALAQEFEGHARTRAFSMLGTTFGVGLAFGPLLAGTLIEHFGWRSIFLTATIVGTIGLIVAIPRLRETRDPFASGVDWPGATTFTGALVLFTAAIMEVPQFGWTSPFIIALFGASVVLLGAFIYVETHVERPMLDLTLFRYPRFVGVQALPIATAFCYVVLLIVLPIRFVGVEGYSVVDAGLVMIALSLPMLIVPFIAAMLAKWIPAGVLSGAGLLIAAVGLVWLSRIAPGQPANAVISPMLLIGFGAGLPWGLMDGLSVSIVPKERAGMASGIFSTMRLASESITIAAAGSIIAAMTQSSLGTAHLPHALHAPQLSQASQLVATGDLPQALAIIPPFARPLLLVGYENAFHDLLYVLATITVVSAAAVFALLSRNETSVGEPAIAGD